MGFFDIFKQKNELAVHHKLDSLKDHVSTSFYALRRDMEDQNKWINYLYQNHEDIRNSHFSHKSAIEKELSNINKWIKHLHTTSLDQEKKLTQLHKSITDAFDVYNKCIMEMYKAMEKVDKEAIKREILEHLEQKKPKQSHEASLLSQNSPLTNPELKLLNLLFNETNPVNYDQLAKKTGNSVNTIRVNMNSLKKKELVDESTLPTGVKLFSIKNKEKIKKIYNIAVL